jgi:flagellar biosynthesis/type III secretory pathway ATPase
MTATVETPTTGDVPEAGTGRVARVIGPVVDVEFSADAMPELYNALEVDVELGELSKVLSLEVAQHIGDNLVRAIALQPTDGLVRGAAVRDTGSPITVPVGDVTKGHVFNTLGEAMDVQGVRRWTSRSAGRSTARRRRSTSSSPRPRCSRPASRSSTCSRRTSRAARSASSAVPASARPCSSRR